MKSTKARQVVNFCLSYFKLIKFHIYELDKIKLSRPSLVVK